MGDEGSRCQFIKGVDGGPGPWDDDRIVLHVLIDLQPRLLADALAIALGGPDVEVVVAGSTPRERGFDVVVVRDVGGLDPRGAVTVEVDPADAGDLDRLLGVLDAARSRAAGQPVPAHPER
jgi:hypothetical protein